MAFNKNVPAQTTFSEPPLKKVWRIILSVLKYPFVISGQISAHQYGVNKIITILKYKQGSENFRQLYGYIQKDNFIKWTYIYLPITLAFASFITLASMNNKKNYQDYYTLLTLPVQEKNVMTSVGKYIKKAYFAVKYVPTTKQELSIFGFFYILAIVGARFAAQHPAFREQERIQKKMKDDRKVDQHGHPWLVVWTKQALLFKTYGTNEDTLFKDASFWTDINFQRVYPRVENQKDMQLMVFARKQEVNKDMKYDFGKFISKIAEDKRLAVEEKQNKKKKA
jgi:hypothetical protein